MSERAKRKGEEIAQGGDARAATARAAAAGARTTTAAAVARQ
jgi:hypothetical protein